MKRILLAALFGTLLVGSATRAHAQEAPDQATADKERTAAAAEGDDVVKSKGEKGVDAEGAQLEDPSLHFNFFNFSYHGKDEYGGKYGDGVMRENGDEGPIVRDENGNPEPEEPMSAPFIFMLFNFALLVWILMKYGGPAARKLAEERHDAIKNALDEAGKLRDQAAAKLKEYEVRLKDSDADIKKLVDGMRADAEAEKARILAAADQQAATMKREAEARISAEIQLARQALTKEVTAAAAAATEKILRERMTPDDQNRMVATFLADVQQAGSAPRVAKEPG